MTEAEIDQQIAAIEGTLRWLRALKGAPASAVAEERKRTVDAAWAFKDAGFTWSEEKIQRVCKNHPEWAVKIGRWCVYEPLFGEFVASVKRGDAEFNLRKPV